MLIFGVLGKSASRSAIADFQFYFQNCGLVDLEELRLAELRLRNLRFLVLNRLLNKQVTFCEVVF